MLLNTCNLSKYREQRLNEKIDAAILDEDVEVFKSLIDSNSGLNIEFDNKSLFYHLVCRENPNYEMVDHLLDLGADPFEADFNTEDYSLDSPVTCCIKSTNEEILNLILQKRDINTVKKDYLQRYLIMPIASTDVEIVRLLANSIDDLSDFDVCFYTPWALAVEKAMVSESIHLNDSDWEGKERNDLEGALLVLKILIENGCQLSKEEFDFTIHYSIDYPITFKFFIEEIYKKYLDENFNLDGKEIIELLDEAIIYEKNLFNEEKKIKLFASLREYLIAYFEEEG